MTNETIYPDRESWEQDFARGRPRYVIGSSSVAKVLGISRFAGPWDVWAKHNGLDDDVTEAQQAIFDRGHKWEPIIADMYRERRPQAHVDTKLRRVTDPKRPWHRVSPDGLIDDTGILEVKTASDRHAWAEDGKVIRDWGRDGGPQDIPPDYAAQAFSLMEATGRRWVDFAVGLPSFTELVELRIIRLYSAPKLQRAMLRKVELWRESYLLGGNTPPIDGSRQANRWLARQERGKDCREAAEDEFELVTRFADLKEQIREREAEKAEIQNLLIEMAGKDGGLVRDGTRARVVTSTGRASISASKLAKALPDVYERLEREGLVSTGKPSAHVRIYAPKKGKKQ